MINDKKPQDGELEEELAGAEDEMGKSEVSENTEPETDETENTSEKSQEDPEQEDTEEPEESEESGESEEPEESDAEDKEISDTANGKKGKKKHKWTREDTRKLRYGGMATGLTAIVIAFVVIINVVAGILNDRFPLTLDLTNNKLYTLSDESKAVAKTITKDVQIVVFSPKSEYESPSTGNDYVNTIYKQFFEYTKEYGTLTNGKITVSYVDLTANPTLASKYTQYSVSSGSILFLCGTRYQTAAATDLYTYDQSSYYYYGTYTNVQSLVEQVLGAKITMVSSENTPVVTLLTGHNEDSDTTSGLKSILGLNNYTTESLDITSSTAFNTKSTLAVIAAPSTDYSKDEITKLRNWLDNSGSLNHQLMVIVNYQAACPNLYEFLNVEYGIQVTDNLVYETSTNNMYNNNAYYAYGNIASTDYTKDLTSSRLLLPVCRQILTNKENNTQNALYNVDVGTFPETAKLVKMSDAVKSSSDSSTTVTPKAASEYPIIGLAYATKWKYDSNNTAHYTNVLVSGCQQAFISGVLSMTSVDNEKVTLNLLNGFTGNSNKVTISSKTLDKTSLEFTSMQANIFWVVFVFLVPIALLVVCIIVFVRRRRL